MHSLLKRAAFTLVLLILMSTNLYAHKSHNNKAPWDACGDKKINDACHWVTEQHSIYEGSCRSISDSLICVRTKPIRKEGTPKTEENEGKNDSTGWINGLYFLLLLGILGAGFTLYKNEEN